MNSSVKSVIFWLAVVLAAMVIYVYSSSPGRTFGTEQTAGTDPLSGTWILNRAKSHNGGGAEARQEEEMVCTAEGNVVDCKISSVRVDGRKLTAAFRARYGGTPSAVSGIPDVDQVTLIKRDDSVADATFLSRGRPVFGYRSVKSADRRSLTMISVDPETRGILSSVVIYDRR